MAWHDTPRNKIREQLDNENKQKQQQYNITTYTPLERIQITARKHT